MSRDMTDIYDELMAGNPHAGEAELAALADEQRGGTVPLLVRLERRHVAGLDALATRRGGGRKAPGDVRLTRMDLIRMAIEWFLDALPFLGDGKSIDQLELPIAEQEKTDG